MTKTTKYPGFTEEQQPIMEFIEDMAFTLLRHRSDGSVYFLTRILLAIRTSADAYQQFYQIEIPGGWLPMRRAITENLRSRLDAQFLEDMRQAAACRERS